MVRHITRALIAAALVCLAQAGAIAGPFDQGAPFLLGIGDNLYVDNGVLRSRTTGAVAFATSGTYVPSTGVRMTLLWLWGGGAGGGGGARCLTNVGCSGGAGGGGGAFIGPILLIPPAGHSFTISVAAGGLGGAPAASDSTPGGAGGVGGNTIIRDIDANKNLRSVGNGSGSYLDSSQSAFAQGGQIAATSTGGVGGQPGQNSPYLIPAAAGGVGTTAAPASGGVGAGGAGSAADGTASHGTTNSQAGAGGGSGGGISSSAAAHNGGDGAGVEGKYTAAQAGGIVPAGGTVSSPDGGSSSVDDLIGERFIAAASGAGGYGNPSGNAGNGGSAGLVSGGGGGGSAGNGHTAGAGGNGGQGFIIIMELF